MDELNNETVILRAQIAELQSQISALECQKKEFQKELLDAENDRRSFFPHLR